LATAISLLNSAFKGEIQLRRSIQKTGILLALVAVTACSERVAIDYTGPLADWPSYGGEPGGGHYSPATQITPQNVSDLEQAWVYRSGDVRQSGEGTVKYPHGKTFPHLGSSWQMTPLLIEDTLYGCTAFNRMIALDPTTGEEKWSYDPQVDIQQEVVVNCRGVSSWRSDEPADEYCGHRIFMGTMDGRLIAVDANTGTPCEDFGSGGEVSLKVGLGEHIEYEYSTLSPPAILGNKVIVGAQVLDRVHDDMPSGVVRAYDAKTGALVWYWDPTPPGQTQQRDANNEPIFHRGTPNVWSIISVDIQRDLVFLPTGNTSTDFYGGQRDNLDYYSSSVVALNGSTGEVVWHYQMVHHDIWDYDTPAQPTLFEFERDGKSIPALAQPTKMGHLFLLNRETGEPLFPVEERAVPQDYLVDGEYLSATQPFPTLPPALHPATLSPEDAWGLTFWDRNACRRTLGELRNEGIFTPPSLQGSVFYPSDFGGNNWDTPAIDPATNTAILNSRFIPSNLKLLPREQCDDSTAPQMGTPYCVQVTPITSPLGMPCSAPPWGTLVAVDLNKGEIKWEVPLGTLEEMAPWPVSMIKGPPNIGGPLVTGSGLTFIAGSADQYLRAFDTDSGRELWKAKLPSGGHANPMTFRSGKDQKQYVVITVGGHFGMALYGQTPGDYIIAFALGDTQ
jgi:quinoprotein glucose dehydrogenase